MAQEIRRSFPLLPVKHWWSLRDQFKRSLPSAVNPNYLASLFDMTERSAQNNIIPYLRQMGIIDEGGKPTDRAVKWRDDDQYAEVCKAILQETYPDKLRDVATDPEGDKDQARRWFANTTRAGEAAVNKMLAVYQTLLRADPAETRPERAPIKSERVVRKTRKAPPDIAATTPTQEKPLKGGDLVANVNPVPQVHLNIQIHLSPEATAEQIDLIFESMARHLRSPRSEA